MAKKPDEKTHWAILIGINYYAAERDLDGNVRNLDGSVRDVTDMAKFLAEGTTAVKTFILTATTPVEKSNPPRPFEEEDNWPTRARFRAKMNEVIEHAKPGNFVYIHFSGHGTLIDGDSSFVLFESNKYGCTYFRGTQLATYLLRMVEKGLLVTLVLDCCFSGGIVRGRGQRSVEVRFIDYNPDIDAASPYEDEWVPYEDSAVSHRGWRNSKIALKEWKVNPNGYTILSSCGPYEKASELELQLLDNVTERRGALSYFLLLSLGQLRKSGVQITLRSLYQHICTRFHVSHPQQNPMRYGNKDFSFFGNLMTTTDRSFVPVYTTDDETLRLSAGLAHGVYRGDEYALYLFNSAEGSTSQADDALTTAQVCTVRCLTSDLEGVDPEIIPKEANKTGWKAKPLTHLNPWKISARLEKDICVSQEQLDAAKQRPFLMLLSNDEDTEPCIFMVTINSHREYEIVDGFQSPIPNMPTVPLGEDGAFEAIMDALQHLATFKYFEGIENREPSGSFEASFSLTPDLEPGVSGSFDITHGNAWELTVQNNDEKTLYLTIFNFTPTWQIVNLVSDAKGNEFAVLPPKSDENTKGRDLIKISMSVPDSLKNKGVKKCEDIMKIFVTSRPTSFPSMVLPPIPRSVENLSRHRFELEQQLVRFITELNTDFRRGNNQVQEEWATQNFIIRTTAP